MSDSHVAVTSSSAYAVDQQVSETSNIIILKYDPSFISSALASEPSFMLLDEPLAGIDPINVADIRALVGHLKDRGLGVLITDHNVRDTLDIIDRAYILHEGRVMMEGRPDEIVADEGVRRVYLGERFSL